MNFTERENLIIKVRQITREKKINPVTVENLKKTDASLSVLLDKYISSNEILAELILENERKQIENILLNYEDDKDNSLDILFKVSKEISDNFLKLSPALTLQFKNLYPDVYKKHFDKKADFVYERISNNIQRGIWQGYYRDDISYELVARRYISRLIDIYNPDNFPPENISFSTVFIELFDNFVKSIATEKGIKYWEEKKKYHKL